MAATFQSARVTAPAKPARAGIGEVVSVTESFAFLAASHNTINNIFEMVKVPKGAVILDVILASTDLETGGPTGSLAVGDGTTADRFIGTNTLVQAGGVARMDKPGGMGYEYAAEDTIDLKLIAAATTPADGTISLTVLYAMQK